MKKMKYVYEVLNLIINGLPSKLSAIGHDSTAEIISVLNLIINGLPSKLQYVKLLASCN